MPSETSRCKGPSVLTEKNLHVSGPAGFKPMLFEGQLYTTTPFACLFCFCGQIVPGNIIRCYLKKKKKKSAVKYVSEAADEVTQASLFTPCLPACRRASHISKKREQWLSVPRLTWLWNPMAWKIICDSCSMKETLGNVDLL